MQTRRLGSFEVSAIGMGCFPIAAYVGDLEADAPERTVHAALDAGIRWFDTARAYAPGGDNGFGEVQLAGALRSWSGDRDDVLVATKVVSTLLPDGSWDRDGRTASVRDHAEQACRRLGVDHLDVLQAHAVDPDVPFDETMGAFADLQRDGLVREVGVSNVDVAELALARTVVDVASVQNESGADGIDEQMVAVCAADGIAFLPYSPFGGPSRAASLADRHPVLVEVADRHDATAHEVCLAWLLALSDVVLPIPAATRPATIVSSASAADLTLSPDDLAQLDATLR